MQHYQLHYLKRINHVIFAPICLDKKNYLYKPKYKSKITLRNYANQNVDTMTSTDILLIIKCLGGFISSMYTSFIIITEKYFQKI